MKILIVATSDTIGGAAKASNRLHNALLNNGVDSTMLVQSKSNDDYTVIGSKTKKEFIINKMRNTLDALPLKFYKKTKTPFSINWLPFSNIVDKINKINSDVVHLHWINAGMLKIEDLKKIKAPIVWSLHDMWAFTGGCNYDEECGRYINSCGECKVLNSKKDNDLSKYIFNRKKSVYSQLNNLTIIGLSKWLNECSKSSTLLKDKKHINLPNLIDTLVFKPFNKKDVRELWNLPKDKKLVLFGAMGATSDPRKGFDELSETLNKLEIDNIELVIFGSSKPKNPPKFKFKTHYLGHLNDDISLITLYSAVGVMIVPSLQENLSNTIMESLACGTPVVGFDIGGNSDMIEHQKNGYLAKPFDTTDLKDGVEWILNNDNYNALCTNAREKVLKEFDSVVVAKKYIELYNEIIRKRS
jgi:glycosyltransferase involved in cell wall biosynthesis